MGQFLVSPDGLLSETAVVAQVEWYRTQASNLDPASFEAHFMLLRGAEAIEKDSPSLEKRGLSRARFDILRSLYEAEGGRMVMRDIVQLLNVSPTNITKLVDGLERAEYVERVDNDLDKRRVWVQLLPEGSRLVEDVLPGVVDHVHGLWSGLTAEEKRMLVHLVAKLRLSVLTGSFAEQLGDQRPGEKSPAGA